MGSSLGGSVVTFILFLNKANSTNVGQNAVLLAIISYILLSVFVVLLIALMFSINKLRNNTNIIERANKQ